MSKKVNKTISYAMTAAMIASILGTTPAIAQPIATKGSEPTSISTHRLSGENRYDTAIAISQKGWTTSDTVVLANGEQYADALCAGPLAKKYNAPILLTSSTAISNKTLDELKRLQVKNIIIAGGTGAVAVNVENQLRSAGYTEINRIGGQNRYETSVMIASKLDNPNAIVIASGENFPDALSISSIASKLGMPVLLSAKDGLSDYAKKYIIENNISKTYIVGGEGVLSAAIESAVPSPTRVSGNNRYETNLAVMKAFESNLNFDNVYISTGEEFADALSGAELAALTASPIVLANQTIGSTVHDYLKTKLNGKSNIVALGGQGAVTDAVAQNVIEDTTVNTVTTPATPSTGDESSIVATTPNTPNISGGSSSRDSSRDSNGYSSNEIIVASENKDLSDGSTHTNNYTISTDGIYGDSAKTSTINGNINITDSGASPSQTLTLQNLNIVGGTISVNFGAGNVIFNNVKVNGVTVTNVGSNSLHITGNSSITTLTVNDSNNDAHIVVEGNASISKATVLSGAKLEVATTATNANPFADVTLSPRVAIEPISFTGVFGKVNVTAPANVTLQGGRVDSLNMDTLATNTKVNLDSNSNLGSVTVKSDVVIAGAGVINSVTVASTGVKLDLQASTVGVLVVSAAATGATINTATDTTITTLNANVATNIIGTGTIKTANLGVSGTTIETKPTIIVVLPGITGITVTVGGETATVGGQTATSDKIIQSMPSLFPITAQYGTTYANLGLPLGVEINTTEGIIYTNIIWDNGTPTYTETTTGCAIFNGIVTLPSNVTNPKNIPLTTTQMVNIIPGFSGNSGETTHKSAIIQSMPSPFPITTQYGTTYANLGLPLVVEINTTEGIIYTNVIWDNGTPTYTETTTGCAIFNGAVTLPNNVTNPRNIPLTITQMINILPPPPAITSFIIAGEDRNAIIDRVAHTVTVHMMNSVGVKALRPQIGLLQGAIVSPVSGSLEDFTNPVTYTVTTQDGTQQTWTVTCIVEPAP